MWGVIRRRNGCDGEGAWLYTGRGLSGEAVPSVALREEPKGTGKSPEGGGGPREDG